MSKEESLKNNKTDFLVSVSNSVVGAVPYIGPLLSELISHTIPNQRIDRLTKYCIELNDKLSNLSKETVEAFKSNDEFIDLIEESFVQASRALSDDRRKYIASIVANGISDTLLELEESKYLLKLLQELSDVEIIWLRYYLAVSKEEDTEFREKHKNVISHVVEHMGSDDTIYNKAAIQESYKMHLERLKLIKSKIKMDRKTGIPIFDLNSGVTKTTRTRATRLGRLLLSQIDLVKESYN